jgi:hypothetical protein
LAHSELYSIIAKGVTPSYFDIGYSSIFPNSHLHIHKWRSPAHFTGQFRIARRHFANELAALDISLLFEDASAFVEVGLALWRGGGGDVSSIVRPTTYASPPSNAITMTIRKKRVLFTLSQDMRLSTAVNQHRLQSRGKCSLFATASIEN